MAIPHALRKPYMPDWRDRMEIIRAVIEAGQAIMEHRDKGFVTDRKDDLSFVTSADHAAEARIFSRLDAAFPGVAILSEEDGMHGDLRRLDDPVFIIDPLDGTRNFVHARDDFCVLVALVVARRPVLGCIGAPARGEVYFADERAWKAAIGTPVTLPDFDLIACRRRPIENAIGVVSPDGDQVRECDWLARRGMTRVEELGSALKFASLAQGQADGLCRFQSLSEWDLAAGQALVEAAGAEMAGLSGEPLTYLNEGDGYRMPPFFALGPTDD
jgi:3'(2'), 5'-bisphosphate nucleotidase